MPHRKHLLVNPEKFVFHATNVPYLGFILSEASVEMDPRKVEAILKWSSPVSMKEVQKFLGLANFYRKFITNFSETVPPITSLLKKSSLPFFWSSEAEKAFQKLKEGFSSAPILRQPDQE
ncbi:uncharacterized protein [Ambystoma mexicanum]|uniref:uncharacterized protein n=1 Tax=Ambystoma mexicanum TaxID=8296 RepID=UPI0037E7053D